MVVSGGGVLDRALETCHSRFLAAEARSCRIGPRRRLHRAAVGHSGRLAGGRRCPRRVCRRVDLRGLVGHRPGRRLPSWGDTRRRPRNRGRSNRRGPRRRRQLAHFRGSGRGWAPRRRLGQAALRRGRGPRLRRGRLSTRVPKPLRRAVAASRQRDARGSSAGNRRSRPSRRRRRSGRPTRRFGGVWRGWTRMPRGQSRLVRTGLRLRAERERQQCRGEQRHTNAHEQLRRQRRPQDAALAARWCRLSRGSRRRGIQCRQPGEDRHRRRRLRRKCFRRCLGDARNASRYHWPIHAGIPRFAVCSKARKSNEDGFPRPSVLFIGIECADLEALADFEGWEESETSGDCASAVAVSPDIPGPRAPSRCWRGCCSPRPADTPGAQVLCSTSSIHDSDRATAASCQGRRQCAVSKILGSSERGYCVD